MISTSQREHLTYTAIGQAASLVAVWLLLWLYVLPGFATISTNIETANTAIDEYTTLRDNGIPFNELLKTLTPIKSKEELVKIIQAAPKETESAIKKQGKGEYLLWLKNAIGNSDEDKKKLVQAKQKLNSILPTMSPIGTNIDEENVTLKQYIRFIEGNILKTFDLKSNIPLGLQGIAYGDGRNGVPKNVGTFDLKLDFKATNNNIQKLINFVNNSGDPTILSDSGVITDETKIPRVLSNPLLTIESLSLQNTLDLTRPGDLNSGRISMRFYVRGSSKDDIAFLKEAVKEREWALWKQIEAAIAECKKRDILCNNQTRLEEFNTKYKEFLRSLGGISSGGDPIYTINNEVNSLRSLEEEFQTLTPNTLTQ